MYLILACRIQSCRAFTRADPDCEWNPTPLFMGSFSVCCNDSVLQTQPQQPAPFWPCMSPENTEKLHRKLTWAAWLLKRTFDIDTLHVVDHLDYIKCHAERRAFVSLCFTDVWLLLISGVGFSRTSSVILERTLLTWEVSRTNRSACCFNPLAARKLQELCTLLFF